MNTPTIYPPNLSLKALFPEQRSRCNVPSGTPTDHNQIRHGHCIIPYSTAPLPTEKKKLRSLNDPSLFTDQTKRRAVGTPWHYIDRKQFTALVGINTSYATGNQLRNCSNSRQTGHTSRSRRQADHIRRSPTQLRQKAKDASIQQAHQSDLSCRICSRN